MIFGSLAKGLCSTLMSNYRDALFIDHRSLLRQGRKKRNPNSQLQLDRRTTIREEDELGSTRGPMEP